MLKAKLLVVGVVVLFSIPAWCVPTCNSNQVGGTVFYDINASGSQDSGEEGVSDITVTAYDSNGNLAATAQSDSLGEYVLAGLAQGAQIRIQFSALPSYLRPGAFGSGSGTLTQFVTVDGACTINAGVANPAEHCEADPNVTVPCYSPGDRVVADAGRDADTVVFFPYSSTGGTSMGGMLSSGYVPPQHAATHLQTGALWGVAYQRSTKTAFYASVLKRLSDFGPLGPGGIYSIDYSDPNNPVYSEFVDLSTLGISFGANPRDAAWPFPFQEAGVGLGAPQHLPDPAYWDGFGFQFTQDPVQFYDANVSERTGKYSLGDIDISDDESTLFVMHLENRAVYEIAIGNPASTPTASDVTVRALSNPGCSNDDWRPWALKFFRGELFAGIVCSAETSQDRNDLAFYVQRMTPAGTFETVLTGPLNFARGRSLLTTSLVVLASEDGWQPWIRDVQYDGNGNPVSGGTFDILPAFPPIPAPINTVAAINSPQPILADIEFDTAGNMLLGFGDRWGLQSGSLNLAPEPLLTGRINTLPTGYQVGIYTIGTASAGDLMYACKSGTSWILESNASCGSKGPTAGANNTQGPDGGEFFFDEFLLDAGLDDGHEEIVLGGLAIKGDTNEVQAVIFDPFSFETGGVERYSLVDGSVVAEYEVYPNDAGSTNFGKGQGLGDVELMCEAAPLQVGNRIWFDLDGDGFQDPGEIPLVGVTVLLIDKSTGNTVQTTTTDAQGEYYFGDISPRASYSIKIDPSNFETGGPLAGMQLTMADQGNDDSIDSDGMTMDGMVLVMFDAGVAGENNHTFDFGFVLTVSQSDLSQELADLDGGSNVLALAARRAVRLGVRSSCISKSKKRSKLNLLNSLRDQVWSELWLGLSSLTYVFSDGFPAAICSEVDQDTQIESISGLLNRIRKVGRSSIKCSDSRSAKRVRRSLSKKLSREQAALAAYPNPLIQCDAL